MERRITTTYAGDLLEELAEISKADKAPPRSYCDKVCV